MTILKFAAVVGCLSVLTAAPAYAQAPADSVTKPAQFVGVDSTSLARSARATRFVGAKVFQGDIAIGEIEDVLIDLDHGTATAVILSVGGFLGIGEKSVAVPVNQIKAGSEARFTSTITKEQLAIAPRFAFDKLK